MKTNKKKRYILSHNHRFGETIYIFDSYSDINQLELEYMKVIEQLEIEYDEDWEFIDIKEFPNKEDIPTIDLKKSIKE